MKTSPILVTGMPRSATTWLGKALSAHPRVQYVGEPFNPRIYNTLIRRQVTFPHWFMHLTDANAAPYTPDLDRLYTRWWRYSYPSWRVRNLRGLKMSLAFSAHALACRARGGVPLFKDPIALLSAPWLADRYALSVVVTFRHPLSFVGSMKRKGWDFDFANFAEQPDVVDALLAPFRDEILRESRSPSSLVVRAALLWKMLAHVVRTYQRDRPDWIFERAEDLAAQPAERVRAICARIGLDFDHHIRARTAELSSTNNPVDVGDNDQWWMRDVSKVGDLWKQRLDPDEAAQVRRLTDPQWRHFYTEDSWNESPTQNPSA